jgi:tetratricopeptide (TPR) repeat protein
LGDLERRLGHVAAARAHYDAALPLYEAERDPVGKMNVFWSQARLERDLGHTEQALAYYRQVLDMAEHIPGYADHPVTRELRQEYQALLSGQSVGAPPGQAQPMTDNPAAAAIQALLTGARDEASFRAVVEQHPTLLELPTLTMLADAIVQAHTQGQTQTALLPTVLLGALLEMYNHAHVENINPTAHAAFIDLYIRVLPVLQALNEPDLLQGVQHSLAQALNTLGNHHAENGQHQEAIVVYTRALEYSPTFAMLHRNRAGEYLELKDYPCAQADIEKAQELEPDARRLPELWRDLYMAQGNGAALLPHAITLRDRKPEDANGYYYVALALGMSGQTDQAVESMRESRRRASENQRAQGLATLQKMVGEFPQHAAALGRLGEVLKEGLGA